MIRLLPALALIAGCAFVPSEAIDERLDADGDGAVAPAFGGDDCADDDAAVNPSATDAPGDTVDQDCDGAAFCPDGDDDADGVCDGVDACSAGPDGSDADADGVPDACDKCAGDDAIDLDGDTVPDACDLDDDGDDVPDAAELEYGSDPRVEDTDGDGILDGVENANHDGVIDPSETDAFDEDTDGDGLCDGDVLVEDCVGAEGLSGTEPLDDDTDGDELLDGEEVDRTKTSPLISDSDADNIEDGVEDRTDTDPNAPDTDGDGWPDGGEDRDWDGVVDADETDPRQEDTDEDGLEDPDEAGIDHNVGPAETDPRDPDTDGDGLLDGAEAVGDFDTDGLVDARDTDSDADGLADGAEVVLGTGVHDKDSDDDGLLDGDEVANWLSSPLVADTDGDSLTDGYEAKTSKTDPTAKDTDDDGLDDDVELEVATDPLDADTDDDGLTDGVEDTDGSDPLDDDSDDDSLLDGAEDTDGTDPLDPDSDSDGRCDGPRLDGDGDGVDPIDACGWVWFVDASAAPGGDGTSWATAFKSFPDHAVLGDNDVWVRAGTYRPVVAGQPVLALDGTTRVYGGFAGTEVVFTDRPSTPLLTVLEGDRDSSGGPTFGDSAHVISAPGGAVVDGFVVRHGNSTNGGAGLYVDGAQDLIVRDVRFEDGYTTGSGGGVYARFADLTLEDVQIVRGRAGIEAGGLYVEGGTVSLVDVDVTGGDAPIGAGMVVRLGTLHVDQAWVHANRTTTGVAAAGAAFLGATVDGTGLRIEANELNDAPLCQSSTVSGGGGLYIGAGSNVTIDDGTVSGNIAQLVGGACVANSTLTFRGSKLYDNTGVNAIYVADGGNLAVVDSEVVGSSVSLVHTSGANVRVAVVGSTVAQRSSVIALNFASAAYVRVIGSSLSGAVFATAVVDLAVSHTMVDSPLNVSGSAVVDHTGARGFTGPGAGNLDLSGDPFIRRDLDVDGAPELYLKHAGLDAQGVDGPGVNGGDATVLDALLAPYVLDWRLGSTRSDGALDSGAPDLGRHD